MPPAPSPPRRRGAAYIRFSSLMQKDSFSLEAQERQIRARAGQDGVPILHVFSDPALSAYRKRLRPGIVALLEAARRGEFDILYIHKVDRLARRLRWALEIVDELAQLGVTVKAVEQNFDLSTPEGKLIFNFLGGLGEFYSDNLSQETHKGKRERALSGYHNGSLAWGYRSETVNGKRQAVLIPELQSVLAELFERFSTGLYSDLEMADWLNAQGFRRPSGRLFTKDTVRAMLQNPFYAGQVRYRGVRQPGVNYRQLSGERTPGKHEAVVSVEVFDRCQAVRAARRQVKTRTFPRHVYYLNGLVECAQCGRRLRAQSAANGTRYYREVSRSRGYQDCPHAGRSVYARELDEQIAALVTGLTLPSDWQAQVRAQLQVETETPAKREQEGARLRAELRRLRDNYEHNLYQGEEHVYWRKVEQLRAELAAQEAEPLTPVMELGEQLLTIQRAWALATEDERREFVHLLMEAVGCDVAARRVVWLRSRPGYEVLFQWAPQLERVAEAGLCRWRVVPRDIDAPLAKKR